MAVPTNTIQTPSLVGLREDLSDVVINISPTETPFYTKCKKGSAKSVKHEWLTDEIRAAGVNAHVQGDDSTATAHVPRVRLDNYTQIFKEVASVSGTAEAADYAGPRKAMADEILKKTTALKKDVELALFANQAKVAPTTSVAGRLAGLPAWIKTNTIAGVGGSDPAGNGSNTRGAGTNAVFTEDNLNSALQKLWTAGAKGTDVFLRADLLKTASSFTGAASRREVKDVGKVSNMIDIYITNFGMVEFTPSREIRATDVIVASMSYMSVDSLRAWKQSPRAKTGDSEKVQIVGELTFAPGEEAALAIIADRIP